MSLRVLLIAKLRLENSFGQTLVNYQKLISKSEEFIRHETQRSETTNAAQNQNQRLYKETSKVTLKCDKFKQIFL